MRVQLMMRFAAITVSTLMLAACVMDGGPGIKVDTPGGDATSSSSTFSISGKVSSAAGIFVDGDTNDASATYVNNDTPATAQAIANIVSLQGYASVIGQGIRANDARYFDAGDVDDYFKVPLEAGQRIQLQVLNASAANDLDLYVLSTNQAQIAASNARGESAKTESITIAATGEYLINVHAYAGASRYILKIFPSTGVSSQPPVFVAGEMVVQYKPVVSLARRSFDAPAETELPVLEPLSSVQVLRRQAVDPLQAFNAELYELRRTLIEIKHKNAQDDVQFAEPNYLRHTTAMPNDAMYETQWHYPAINLPQAWDITTGSAANDVIVAVLDTGVFLNHVDLAGKLVAGYDFISNAANARDGDGIDNNPDDPGDNDSLRNSSWHGTHVAGTIAARTNNSQGIAGVSWGAKIMPVRVLGKNGGTSYDLAQGILYAAGLPNDSRTLPARRADIINLSLGASGASVVEENAIKAAIRAGVLVVAAAGNDNTSAKFYPAAYDGVIAVSATRFTPMKASYSNYGSYIKVAAPGGELAENMNKDGYNDGILSTFVNIDASGKRVSSYAFAQGTSMATPHVAGVLALMKALKPTLTQQEVLGYLSSCQITHKTTCSHDNNLGYGVIDAYAAVQAVNSNLTSTPAILVASQTEVAFSTVSGRQTVNVTNLGSASATNLTVSGKPAWLNVTLGATFLNKNASTIMELTLNNPTALPGIYRANLTLNYQSDGTVKSLVIPVSLTVGTLSGGDMTTQYVLLENLECSAGCIQSAIMDSGGRFSFTNVPVGTYRIHVGSDIDANGFICEVGETCGRYPNHQPLILNRHINNANVRVSLVDAIGVTADDSVQPMQIVKPAEHHSVLRLLAP